MRSGALKRAAKSASAAPNPENAAENVPAAVAARKNKGKRRQLKPHKEVLYVRGIVTYFGHNTSLLFYTASLLPLTLP